MNASEKVGMITHIGWIFIPTYCILLLSHINISAKAEYPEPKLVKNVIEILL